VCVCAVGVFDEDLHLDVCVERVVDGRGRWEPFQVRVKGRTRPLFAVPPALVLDGVGLWESKFRGVVLPR